MEETKKKTRKISSGRIEHVIYSTARWLTNLVDRRSRWEGGVELEKRNKLEYLPGKYTKTYVQRQWQQRTLSCQIV